MTEEQLDTLEEDAWLDSPLGDSDRRIFKIAFNEGVKRLLQQHLSNRLSNSEKKEIIDIYKELKEQITREKRSLQTSWYKPDQDVAYERIIVYEGQIDMLETIFGVELFEE